MYILNTLFWYKAIFLTELIIAEVMFCFRLKKKNHFVLRVVGSLVILYGIAFGFPIFAYNSLYCSFMFLCLAALTLFALKFCFKSGWFTLFFCAIASYTVQHIAFDVFSFFTTVFNLNSAGNGIYQSTSTGFFTNIYIAITYFITIPIVYYLMFIFFANKIKKNRELQLKSYSLFSMVILIIIIDIILSAVVIYYSYDNYDIFYLSFIYVFNVISCVLALFIQFDIAIRKNLEEEIETVKRINEQEKKQYMISKENIDLINIKCHDLKHRIREIAELKEVDTDTIKDLENSIAIYDSKVETNNRVLDTIFTEKSLLCKQKNINFACMVDGEKLKFMTENDAYSLFGNLIDNAIEAVSKLEEGERMIGITIKSMGNLLSINIRNNYREKLVFENNLPVTTKDDKNYHGFGVKSIKYICDKYNGDLSMVAKNNVFNVNILFPIEEDKNEHKA